jgi:hypothetical protein
LWAAEGDERYSGEPMCVLCALHNQGKNYWLKLIFADGYRERRLGKHWLWNVSKAITKAAPNASLILTWSCEWNLRFARSKDWFLVPDWVYGEVALPRDKEALRKVSGDLRRIRTHGLTYEITRDPRQFDDFYYNMHVPHVTRTFGDYAYVLPYEVLREEFQHSDLILIKNGEGSIAGQLIWYVSAGPFLESMGIRDGNHEHVKNGASCALYHFAFQYLEEKGFRKAIVGWSKPLLHNGILRFKRKWSQTITGSRTWGFGLSVLAHTAAVKSFLCNNPFIFKQHNALHAAVFFDSDHFPSPEQIAQLDKDYFHAGLSRLVIYCWKPEYAAMRSAIPPELADHVEMRLAGIEKPHKYEDGVASGVVN